MSTVGYHASHEQFRPSELLEYVRLAEQAGFDAAMCSDHLHPWSERQGQSGFAFGWLGAALQATRLPFGSVNAPGQRYHPVIVAQAVATLLEMFPGRYWLAVGSGENLNEHITGDPWPDKQTRNARLRECVDVMRALWTGHRVQHEGLVRVRDAQLYTLPREMPPLFCAAITPDTARWAGTWANGLLTLAQERSKLVRVIDAFREGGGEGKPLAVQVKVSYARNEEEARAQAYDQWRTNAGDSSVLSGLAMPEDFERQSARVKPEDMDAYVHISADLAWHAARLDEYVQLGFSHIYLHHVGRDQRGFIEAFAAKVLPSVTRSMQGA